VSLETDSIRSAPYLLFLFAFQFACSNIQLQRSSIHRVQRMSKTVRTSFLPFFPSPTSTLVELIQLPRPPSLISFTRLLQILPNPAPPRLGPLQRRPRRHHHDRHLHLYRRHRRRGRRALGHNLPHRHPLLRFRPRCLPVLWQSRLHHRPSFHRRMIAFLSSPLSSATLYERIYLFPLPLLSAMSIFLFSPNRFLCFAFTPFSYARTGPLASNGLMLLSLVTSLQVAC
jgi:hypothetical protein